MEIENGKVQLNKAYHFTLVNIITVTQRIYGLIIANCEF